MCGKQVKREGAEAQPVTGCLSPEKFDILFCRAVFEKYLKGYIATVTQNKGEVFLTISFGRDRSDAGSNCVAANYAGDLVKRLFDARVRAEADGDY